MTAPELIKRIDTLTRTHRIRGLTAELSEDIAKLCEINADLLVALQDMLAADDAICQNRGLKSDQATSRIAAIDNARAAIAKAGGGL
jgi:hypothetical protein